MSAAQSDLFDGSLYGIVSESVSLEYLRIMSCWYKQQIWARESRTRILASLIDSRPGKLVSEEACR